MQDVKMTCPVARQENVGNVNAGHDNAGHEMTGQVTRRGNAGHKNRRHEIAGHKVVTYFSKVKVGKGKRGFV